MRRSAPLVSSPHLLVWPPPVPQLGGEMFPATMPPMLRCFLPRCKRAVPPTIRRCNMLEGLS
jgi:hypothetical protein